MKRLITAAACGGLLAGCATAPENIAPGYVSPVAYEAFSCRQLGEEQLRLQASLATMSDAQRHARTNDTIGVIFLGLPVSSLSGNNVASEIRRLKGENEAVQQSMIRHDCSAPSAPPAAVTPAPAAYHAPVTCRRYAVRVPTDPSQNRCAD